MIEILQCDMALLRLLPDIQILLYILHLPSVALDPNPPNGKCIVRDDLNLKRA